jgi:hypothetical protein
MPGDAKSVLLFHGVASFVKMVEGKQIALTDEDFIPLLVLSDEFGFQKLSDAC